MPIQRSVLSAPSLFPQFAEREEEAAAPHAELYVAGDRPLLAPLDKLIEYRAQEARLKPGPHQDIGRRRAIRSGLDAQLVLGARRHNLVQIGAEDEALLNSF